LIQSRVIQISGTGGQRWRLFTDTETRTDTLTAAAQQFLAGGWLSMRQYAVLDGQVFPKPSDPDNRTDGEWLYNALFGRMPPKSTSKGVQPPGLTVAQCLNLGWLPNPMDSLAVIGTYRHLPVSSMFKYYFLTGLEKGYYERAPPGRMTIGAWQIRLRNDPTIAQDDKLYLWRVFVVSAMLDGALSSPISPAFANLPVLTAAQAQAFAKFRAGRDRLDFDVPMYFLPVFTLVTTVLGAAFPAP
jgi:hypothetical protein